MMKGEWLPCESQRQEGVIQPCHLEMETVALERGLVMEVRGQAQGLLAGPYSHFHIQGREIEQKVSQNNPENRPAQFKEQLEGRESEGALPGWQAPGLHPAAHRPPHLFLALGVSAQHRACDLISFPSLLPGGLTLMLELSSWSSSPGLPAASPAAFSAPTFHRVGAEPPGTPAPTPAGAADTAPGPPLHDGCGSATRERQVPPASLGTACWPRPPTRGNQSPGLRRGHSKSWSTRTARHSCSQLTGAAPVPGLCLFLAFCFSASAGSSCSGPSPRGGIRVGRWGKIWPHICDPDASPFRGPEATTSGGYHFL